MRALLKRARFLSGATFALVVALSPFLLADENKKSFEPPDNVPTSAIVDLHPEHAVAVIKGVRREIPYSALNETLRKELANDRSKVDALRGLQTEGVYEWSSHGMTGNFGEKFLLGSNKLFYWTVDRKTNEYVLVHRGNFKLKGNWIIADVPEFNRLLVVDDARFVLVKASDYLRSKRIGDRMFGPFRKRPAKTDGP